MKSAQLSGFSFWGSRRGTLLTGKTFFRECRNPGRSRAMRAFEVNCPDSRASFSSLVCRFVRYGVYWADLTPNARWDSAAGGNSAAELPSCLSLSRRK